MSKKDLSKLTVSETSEFLTMSYDEFVSWCAGKLILSIGEGKFREMVYTLVRFAGDWAVYNR